MICFFLVQVLSSGDCWQAMCAGEKRRLIQDCFRSRAAATVSRYILEVRQFLTFQKNHGHPVGIPASVAHLALYLSSVLHKKTKCATQLAYSTLKWVHGILPVCTNPLESMLCRHLVEAEKRAPHKPVAKKEPVDLDLIKAIVEKYASEGSTLKDVGLATMCVLAYAGLFRSKELLDIQLGHIVLSEDYFVIFVPSSKTDVYREGQQVFVVKSAGSRTCPYTLLMRYLKMAAIKLSDDPCQYIFRNVVYLKSTKSYYLGTRKLSYTRLRELFKDCLSALGYNAKLYGLHSFRAGGATCIGQTLNNPSKERLLKLHGRWKSDAAKDMYVKESILDRLEVSKSFF